MLKLNINHSIIESFELISKIAPLYNINNISSCRLLKHSDNDVYILTSEKENFIIKIYSTNSNKNKIDFQINSLIQLSNKSEFVANIIRRNDGSFISDISLPEGNRFLTITSYVNGIELKYKYKKDAFIYGQYVAKLHLISDKAITKKENDYTISIKLLLKDSILIIKSFLILKEKSNELSFFINFYNKLNERIKYFSIKDLNFGFCHGDLHGGNACFIDNSLNFFDFEHCGFGLRAYDIAVFRWSAIIGKRESQWKAFLKGYLSIYSLSNKDLELTNYLIAVRDIWVMAQDIKKTQYFGEEYINIFYIKKRIEFLKKIENIL